MQALQGKLSCVGWLKAAMQALPGLSHAMADEVTVFTAAAVQVMQQPEHCDLQPDNPSAPSQQLDTSSALLSGALGHNSQLVQCTMLRALAEVTARSISCESALGQLQLLIAATTPKIILQLVTVHLQQRRTFAHAAGILQALACISDAEKAVDAHAARHARALHLLSGLQPWLACFCKTEEQEDEAISTVIVELRRHARQTGKADGQWTALVLSACQIFCRDRRAADAASQGLAAELGMTRAVRADAIAHPFAEVLDGATWVEQHTAACRAHLFR